MVQFLLKFIETENCCCAPRFPLIVSCYKNVDSQTSFTLMLSSRCRKFWKSRSRKILEARSRTFYLRLRNPAND